MAFTDKLFKSILQKAIEIEKWAILESDTKLLRGELNFYDILDELRSDGKDGYAKELEKTRDELLGEVQEPPTFASSQTAFGLFKKLRRIIEDRTDDSKKLLLYADIIEDLIKDDVKLYQQIWRGEFITVIDIVLAHFVEDDYDLFNELLVRIRAKNPTAATQLLNNYEQLQKLSNDGKNAHEKQLKAIELAAFNLVSLMREIAESTDVLVTGAPTSGKQIFLDLKRFNKTPSFNLLKALIADGSRKGIVLDKNKHGKKQPQSLREVLKNNGYDDVAKEVKLRGRKVKLYIPFEKITTKPPEIEKNNPA